MTKECLKLLLKKCAKIRELLIDKHDHDHDHDYDDDDDDDDLSFYNMFHLVCNI